MAWSCEVCERSAFQSRSNPPTPPSNPAGAPAGSGRTLTRRLSLRTRTGMPARFEYGSNTPFGVGVTTPFAGVIEAGPGASG
jgi:hypothetical protein